ILFISLIVSVSLIVFTRHNLSSTIKERTELQGNLYKIRSDFEDLQKEHENISTVFENISKRYTDLKDRYGSLKSNTEDVIFSPYVVVKNRTLHISYETEKGNIVSEIDVDKLEEFIITGNLLRNLEKEGFEQINSKYGIGIDSILNKFEGNSKYKNFSDIGRYYQIKPFITTEGLSSITNHIENNYQTNEEKIKAVWKIVNKTTTKTSDLKESPRFPLETLFLGGGDCEDMAFLMASILKPMSNNWDINVVLMDQDNPQNPQKLNHAVVYVDTGDYSTFIETLHSQKMNPYGRIEGFYVEI
ncbi:MAG: hypothetical protein ABEK17_02235, partial [Candidatus Aenigmatarchaeota archaeon]